MEKSVKGAETVSVEREGSRKKDWGGETLGKNAKVEKEVAKNQQD